MEIRIPDIGDFADVPVIEVHVSPGDAVAEEDPLVTLESDKATMDVPSPVAGTIGEVRLAVGDRVSQGDVVATLEGEEQPAAPAKERVHEDAHPDSGEPAGYGSPAGVYDRLEIRVPDIGEFRDVPVIEIHVAPGDTIAAEDPLLTLESDKATMDVPAPTGGTVTGVRVAVGDTVSEGHVIVELQTGEGAVDSQAPPTPALATLPPGGLRPGAGLFRLRRPRPRRRAPGSRPTCRATCSCSGPGRAATAPPSGPPTWASRSCWWTARPPWAGSASTSAASPPRPCSTRPG